MSSLNFEWDDNKNALNQKKHGVSFEEAKTAFADELGRLIPDPDHSDDEERFILMGVSAYSRLLLSAIVSAMKIRYASSLHEKQTNPKNSNMKVVVNA